MGELTLTGLLDRHDKLLYKDQCLGWDEDMSYTLKKSPYSSDFKTPPKQDFWKNAETLEVSHFHKQGSEHKPFTQAQTLYDESGIFLKFKVEDNFVRCVQTEFNSFVCTDSCVEFFFKPPQGKGYFNFEFNCGGTIFSSYIENPTRLKDGSIEKFTCLDPKVLSGVPVYASLPQVVDPEIQTPTVWTIEAKISFSLLEEHIGPLGELSGKSWKANFYKCGDDTSHPHWGSWADVGEKLNFHQPDRFAEIKFE